MSRTQFSRISEMVIAQLNGVKALVHTIGGPLSPDATRAIDNAVSSLESVAKNLQRFRSATGRNQVDNFSTLPLEERVKSSIDVFELAVQDVILTASSLVKESIALIPACDSEAEAESAKSCIASLDTLLGELSWQSVGCAAKQTASLSVRIIDFDALRRRTKKQDQAAGNDLFDESMDSLAGLAALRSFQGVDNGFNASRTHDNGRQGCANW